ncbi:hypothetical protein CRE_17920 [Caenorhabditis remanei]|uniref:Uncharacterized protein n=2 Tax=Caenorhabditis remanei TaxID=31234 RepID=E3MDJ2_CAERE|nr:hypothetical protein CRE_17920 [Caenorhabditis remanei]
MELNIIAKEERSQNSSAPNYPNGAAPAQQHSVLNNLVSSQNSGSSEGNAVSPHSQVELPEGFTSKRDICIDGIPAGFEKEDPQLDHFSLVAGRTSTSHTPVFYNVTTSEVDRRINGIEKLNSSSLACTLKKSKVRNGGEILRKKLEGRGVDLVLNTRQNASPNSIISLTEAEAVHFGKDLDEAIDNGYPQAELAEEFAREALSQENVKLESLLNTEAFMECMSSLNNIISSVVPPCTGLRPKASNNLSLNLGMEEFSQATHGMGIMTNHLWLRELTTLGTDMTKMMKERMEMKKKDDTK